MIHVYPLPKRCSACGSLRVRAILVAETGPATVLCLRCAKRHIEGAPTLGVAVNAPLSLDEEGESETAASRELTSEEQQAAIDAALRGEIELPGDDD